jgi:hypothetical protein
MAQGVKASDLNTRLAHPPDNHLRDQIRLQIASVWLTEYEVVIPVITSKKPALLSLLAPEKLKYGDSGPLWQAYGALLVAFRLFDSEPRFGLFETPANRKCGSGPIDVRPLQRQNLTATRPGRESDLDQCERPIAPAGRPEGLNLIHGQAERILRLRVWQLDSKHGVNRDQVQPESLVERNIQNAGDVPN